MMFVEIELFCWKSNAIVKEMYSLISYKWHLYKFNIVL